MKLRFGSPEQAHVGIDLLSAYLDQQVAPAERVRIEAHLRACASCRGELESLRRTVALLHALPRVPLPRAFTLSESQVGILRPAARPAWYGGLLRGLGAVAAIALVAFIATTLLRRPEASPGATLARAPTTVVAKVAQPAAPTTSASAAAPEQSPAADQVAPKALAVVPPQAAAPTAQPLPAAPAPQANIAAPTAAPAPSEPAAVPTRAPAAEAPRQSATTAPPAPARSVAVPTPTPGVAAAGAASARAAAAVAPATTPEANVLSLGRGGGGPAEMPPDALTPEPTPPLESAQSVLQGKAGIAYADWRSLWVVDSGGPRQLLQREGVNSPQISPDGAWIAFRVQDGDSSDLWVIRWDGQDARPLLMERELPKDGLDSQYTERRIQDIRWIPGRDVLAVITVAIPASSAAAALPTFDLWNLDLTGQLTHVANLGHFSQPVYAPDGSRFALVEYGTETDPQGSLVLFNADGTGERVALRFPAGPNKPSYASQVAWLPDSSGLWVAIPDAAAEPGQAAASGESQPYNGTTLYRVPAAGGDAAVIGQIDAFTVYWSPDASRMAYDRVVNDNPDTRELYLANADGTNPQLYASLNYGQFVNWSPDSQHFIYQDNYDAYLGAAGQAPRRLGKAISLFDPRWISAGQILALQDTGTDWLVVSRGLDGSAVGLLSLPRDAGYDVTKP